MKKYLRFYIKINAVSEFTWAEIKNFLGDVENLRGSRDERVERFDFHQLEIYSSIEPKDDVMPFLKLLSKNFGRMLGNEFFLTNKVRQKLQEYEVVDFVIILKLVNRFIDFKLLIPFFLIHEKFPNTALGIDLNEISDKTVQNHLRFSIGQFLWRWKKARSNYAKHLVFCILDLEISNPNTGKSRKIEISSFPTKGGIVLKRFSPLIEIDELIFDQLFVNTLTKTIIDIKETQGKDTASYNPLVFLKAEDFLVEKDNVDIKNLFVRRYIDFREKAKLDKVIEDLLYENFKNEPFIGFYIFCMIIDQLMQEYSITNERNECWQKSIIELYNDNKILNYIYLIRRYVTGLREVAENIIFHTESKKGFFYFVLKSSNEYAYNLEVDQAELKQNKRYKELYLKLLKTKFDNLPKRFLEVVLMDISEVGIIEKYKSDLIANKNYLDIRDEEKANLESLQLEDFYVGKFFRFPGVSHLDMRYLAQLGLKTFASIIKNKRGYFEVETNQGKIKRKLVFFRNIKSLEEQNKKWFDEIIEQSIGDGTYYDILLPVSEALIKDEDEVKTTFEVKSFIEIFEKWLHSDNDKEPEITNFTAFEDFSVTAFDKKESFVEKIGEIIVQSFIKKNKSSILSVDFEIVRQNSIDFSTFIKILTYVQLANQINCIILFNLNKDSFNQMMSQLKILADFGKFWNNHSWIYLYDENGVPFIVTGEDAVACDNLNKTVALHYGYCYSILKDSSENVLVEAIDYKILPFELLIMTTNKNRIPVSLFEKNVYCILNKKVEAPDLGVKIEDAHMRLGSKIHLDNFYEAEVLFHDNFYVERFAYLAARDIYRLRRNKNKILLIGYGSYSEMFLNRTKHILNYEAQSKYDSKELDICPAYFICNDVEELKWQGIEGLRELNAYEEFDFALIVPVASSLTTNYKISKNFKHESSKITKISNFYEENKLIFNTAIILIRDKIEDFPTEKEMSYNWEFIENKQKVVKTSNFKNPIKFYICEQGGWNRPINCSRCFPDLYGDGKLIDEKMLLETNKASINPKLVLSWPKVEVENFNSEIENERIKGLDGCIKYGHIERNSYHHLYYIDTLKFFEINENKRNIRKWLETIAASVLGDVNAYNIIVSVLHHSNTGFVNLVNDTVFNGAATVIILDLEQEFRDNIITKYSYLKSFKGKIKFHFVDDAILTGGNFIMARSFVSSIFEELGGARESKSNVEIFSSIVILLNRLSAYRKKDFLQIRRKFDFDSTEYRYSIFQSYITLFIPPIRDPEAFCYICRYKEEYRKLSDLSILDKLKSFFNEKANKLEIKSEFQEEYAESRIFFRLHLTHDIYYQLSNSVQDHKDIIGSVWNLKSDISFKIDVIKVLSSPLLSYYKNIETIVFSKMVTELDILLNKRKSDIDILDFNLLITLMKQLTQLNSNFILREINIERIWRFYSNYKSNYDCFFKKLYDVAKPIEYLKLIAKLLKDEKKLNELKSKNFPEKDLLMFYARIREIEERIHKISKEDFLPLKQKLKILINKLEIEDPHLIAKTIFNVAEFKLNYVILVKMLVHTNESKSLWIEYLFRTGKELPKIANYSEFKNIPSNLTYNDLHRKFNNDKYVDKEINREYKEFFVMVKIENVTILQRAMNKFVDESYHKELKNKIKGRGFQLSNINIEDEFRYFLDKINSEYYYEYLRQFVSESNSKIYRKIFNLYVLRTYIQLLRYDEDPSRLSIEEVFDEITKQLTEIMSADKGFFTIRKFITNEKELYTIGRCKIKSDEIPFELTDEYFTFKMINNVNLEYSFFAPKVDTWSDLERSFSSGIIIIRFFHSNFLKKGELRPTGGITFLYNEIHDESARALIKEDIRYIMLIKDELQLLLEKNFDNENFSNWIETELRTKEIQGRYRKFKHNAGDYSDKLIQATSKDTVSNVYSWLVASDIFIGNHLFAKYLTKESLKDGTQRIVKLKKIFDDSFRYLLKKIPTVLIKEAQIEFNFDKEQIIEKSYPKGLQYIIVSLVLNSLNHRNSPNCVDISIYTEGIFLIVENTNATKIDNIFELIEKIESPKCKTTGITLFTIHKYFFENYGRKIEVEFKLKRNTFTIKLPILK